MKIEVARVSKLQVPNDTYLKRKATRKKVWPPRMRLTLPVLLLLASD